MSYPYFYKAHTSDRPFQNCACFSAWFLFLFFLISGQQSEAASAGDTQEKTPAFSAYLMAYFGPQEKLFYAYSYDARTWKALNGALPVLDAGVRLRDPFLSRVKGAFHLVHTKGWDYPTIFHWSSPDLVNWRGGPIDVVDPSRKRAWAPEFFYCPREDLFYVFWASIYNGHNTMHYVTTKNWNDITPERSGIFFDIGIHDIDLTIVEHEGIYYGFHKPGDVGDLMGNRLSTSKHLDPRKEKFADSGRQGKVVFSGEQKPTEGPEVIKLIGKNLWYIYGDPFRHPMQAWETTDFNKFTQIEVTTPAGSKHCSMIPITREELFTLLTFYPEKLHPRAHAHNDYYHGRPLLDALSHGFLSVEADVLLADGTLYVGHSRLEIRPERTLEALYLKPLAERVQINKGRVFPGGPVFTLHIDIKTDAEKTYAALRKQLEKYSAMLTTVKENKVEEKAVTVLISGNRPKQAIAGKKIRYCGIDGRLGDLDSDLPAHLMPLISDHWGRTFSWRGTGEMPEAEFMKLKQVLDKAHRKNRKVRFWAIPHTTELWKVLLDAGVDFINTDDLPGLDRFLKKEQP